MIRERSYENGRKQHLEFIESIFIDLSNLSDGKEDPSKLLDELFEDVFGNKQ